MVVQTEQLLRDTGIIVPILTIPTEKTVLIATVDTIFHFLGGYLVTAPSERVN